MPIKVNGINFKNIKTKDDDSKSSDDDETSKKIDKLAGDQEALKKAALSDDPVQSLAESQAEQSGKIDIPDHNPIFEALLDNRGPIDSFPIRFSSSDLSKTEAALGDVQEAKDKLGVPSLSIACLNLDAIDYVHCDRYDDVLGMLSQYCGVSLPTKDSPEKLSVALKSVKDTHGLKNARSIIDDYDIATPILHTDCFVLIMASDSKDETNTEAYFALYIKDGDAHMYIPSFGNTFDVSDDGNSLMTYDSTPGAFVSIQCDQDANEEKWVCVVSDPERMAAELNLAVRETPNIYGRTFVSEFGDPQALMVSSSLDSDMIRVGSIASNGSKDAQRFLIGNGSSDGVADGDYDFAVTPTEHFSSTNMRALKAWIGTFKDAYCLSFVKDAPIAMTPSGAIVAQVDFGNLSEHMAEWFII